MDKSGSIVSLAKYSVGILLLISFAGFAYFGSALFGIYDFRKELDIQSKFFNTAQALHRERALKTLMFFEKDLDYSMLEDLRDRSDELLSQVEPNDEFMSTLFKKRALAVDDINATYMLGEYEKLDRLIQRRVDNLRLKNINTEINGILISLSYVLHSNIDQNRMRDFLLIFASNRSYIDDEHFAMLNAFRFEFMDYASVIIRNDLTPAFATFNNVNARLIADEINKLNEESINDRTRFAEIFERILTKRLVDVPVTNIIDLFFKLEQHNIQVANLLIENAQYYISRATSRLWLYLGIAFVVFLYCLYVFVKLNLRKKELLRDLELSKRHVANLKKIAEYRNTSPDSKEIFELFGRISDYIEEGDSIERKYKNEYSYFMNNISHEIISPLNDISGYTDLLKNRKNTPDEQNSYLNSIKEASLNLKKLFENLVKISNIQSKNVELETSRFDLFEGMVTLLSQMSYKAQNANMKFTAYIDPKLDGVIVCDVPKLSYITMTLLENSIKKNRRNSTIMLMVEKLEFRNKKARIRLSMLDKSHDSSALLLNHDFSDDKDTKDKVYNTRSLDLAIANEYLKLMNSSLQIQNVKGKGSAISYEILVDFEPTPRLKNRYKDQKLYIYPQNVEFQSDLDIFEDIKVPSYYDILKIYLDYMGFDYKLEEEACDGVFFMHSASDELDVKKCILASPTQPALLSDDKIWLGDPFTPEMLASSYELLSGHKDGLSSTLRLNIQALVLADEQILSIVSQQISHVSIKLDQDKKYDVAFVDIDNYADEIVKIPRPCKIVALSRASSVPSKLDFSSFVLLPGDESEPNSETQTMLKENIISTLSEFRRKIMLENKNLRDVLLYKKSLAANNIYKSAISTYAPLCDSANSVTELAELLEKHPYKIVLCDHDISGLRLDAYIAIVERARIKHGFNIVAGLFAPTDFRIFSKNFELIDSSLNRAKLELKLRQYLGQLQE